MRKLRHSEETEAVENLFNNLHTNKTNIVVWQPDIEDNESKHKYICKVQEFDREAKTLKIKSRFNKSFAFSEDDIFCFCDKLMFIFKASFVENEKGEIQLALPESVMMLDVSNEDLTRAIKKKDYRLFSKGVGGKTTLMSEDDKYAAMRAAPRSKTTKDQRVTVEFETQSFTPKEFQLHDLSKGGAGIIIKNQDLFKKGDWVLIAQIDGKDINPKLRGKVMSIRTHDMSKGEFKVGLRFEQGE